MHFAHSNMNVTRRTFIQSIAAASTGAYVLAQTPNQSAKLILSAPLTHSDWMLKANGPKWGPEGVRHMLDACKACGWSNVYWRVFDAGVSTYKSTLLRAGDQAEGDNFHQPQSDADRAVRQKYSPISSERDAEIIRRLNAMDYAAFDSFSAAIEYGHTIGLKIWAWASINEDDHGWGWPSEFTKAHPQFRWVRRDGQSYHSQLSFSFPEVRSYKLALIEELITNY